MEIDQDLTAEEISAIAEEAYIYSFPMMMGYRFGYPKYLQPTSPAYSGPPNAGPYGEAVTLDHTFRGVITPQCGHPVLVRIARLPGRTTGAVGPAVTDRYYVMQFEDLFGYNELFVGSRATGSKAGTYFLTGPGWDGDVPSGFSGSHRFETDLVFLLGRTQLLGADDTPALAEVMAQYRLEPYSVFTGGEAPELSPFDWPAWDDEASRDERFLEYLNALLPLCQPPHPDEVEIFARFARIGIGAGRPVDLAALPSETRAAIADGVARARQRLTAAAEGLGADINGWMSMAAFGDREAYGGNYLRRAAESMVGWGGNDKIEAYYPMARADADGNPFDGADNYQLRLETDPPVRAFWSVTMYDTSYDGTAGYMVENPIDRYLVSSVTEGLVRNADGSLTITLQHTEPSDPVERANWLPTPNGRFYLVMRLYWPEQDALDDTWVAPPVVRID